MIAFPQKRPHTVHFNKERRRQGEYRREHWTDQYDLVGSSSLSVVMERQKRENDH
jgi:hypothetical protein